MPLRIAAAACAKIHSTNTTHHARRTYARIQKRRFGLLALHRAYYGSSTACTRTPGGNKNKNTREKKKENKKEEAKKRGNIKKTKTYSRVHFTMLHIDCARVVHPPVCHFDYIFLLPQLAPYEILK